MLKNIDYFNRIRLVFTLFSWNIEFKANALRPWNECRVYRDSGIGTYHVVWGRFSLYIQNNTMEVHPLCAACDSVDVAEVFTGDEGHTYCEACGGIEQGYTYVNLKEYNKRY